MSVAARVYASAPVLVQHGLVSAYGWRWRRIRLGGEWPKFVREFRGREDFTAAEWRAFTTGKLREVLLSAFERVPAYAERWRALGITRARLACFELEDLPSLPILSKNDVRRNPASLLIGGAPAPGTRVFHTSGSTGTPIATYSTPREMQRAMAVREARSANWAKVSFLDSRATFSGRMAVPSAVSAGPFHRYNFFEQQIYFSAFHLGPATVAQYVSALERHRPRWLTGYANSYYTLARLAEEQSLAVPSPRAIVTTSEKLTAAMRATITRVFGCPAFEEYGTVEDVLLATECERGGLHVSPDAGLIEIVDDEGQPVPAETPGRVVATGFLRDQQLFVRFALGDEAAWAATSCSCGRAMPCLREITGRIEDAVIGPDGREMVRFHGIFVDQPHIAEGQIVQTALEAITVNVVPAPGFGQADEDEIRDRIRARLTARVQVRVVTVPAIPRTAAGKFQAVVSHLPKPDATS